jgi:hypothetical protein
MSTSEKIRSLAREGVAVAEIAKRLGIRYQHAYNVLKADGTPQVAHSRSVTAVGIPVNEPVASKPPLSVEELLAGGFVLSGRWILSDTGALTLDRQLSRGVGVYAFANDGIVQYVGVATMGLSKRLYFYAKPGVTQRTSQRLNAIIKNELLGTPWIEIYTAMPTDLEWNALPVHGSAGLELGLIKKFVLPWNMRSAG